MKIEQNLKFRSWCRRRNKIGTKQGEMWMQYLTLQSIANTSNPNFSFIKTGEPGYDEEYILDKETIIMESTGLTDKQGTEVYEGDILSEPDDSISKCKNRKYIVEKGRSGIGDCVGLLFKSIHDYPCNSNKFIPHIADLTVAGNIYENSELLDLLTTEEMIEELIKKDIVSIEQDLSNGDTSLIHAVLSGEGWKQYNLLTNDEIKTEYNERKN